LISTEAPHEGGIQTKPQPEENNIMKPIRIITWLASTLFAASLVSAQSSTDRGTTTGPSSAGDHATQLCKQTRSRDGSGGGKGSGGDRIRKRDGSCQNATLAAGRQKRGGPRDGSGDGCKDGTLAKGGKGGGDRMRKRDGSCHLMA